MKKGVMKRFLELADGDSKACRELVEFYLSKTTEQLQELKEAIARQSSSQVSTIAHSMAGASLMVGVDSIVPVLRTLEHRGEIDDLSGAPEDFDALVKNFKIVRAHLEA
jgi:HPt (histidine-containing phosphotransfer) domain-containing protein